jgi:hypothetical protein
LNFCSVAKGLSDRFHRAHEEVGGCLALQCAGLRLDLMLFGQEVLETVVDGLMNHGCFSFRMGAAGVELRRK